MRIKRIMIWLVLAVIGAGTCIFIFVYRSRNIPREEVTYYPNGQMHQKSAYVLDIWGNKNFQGPRTCWYSNGQVWLKVEYKDGLHHGEETIWHPNGTVACRGFWDNGKETGLWQAWQLDGDKAWEATYKNGQIAGQKTYYLDGKVHRVDIYDNDGYLEKVTQWHADGAKDFEGSLKKGEKDGTWTYWLPDGTVKAQGEWKEGKPWNGVCSVPAPGDAGSWGGILYFKVYKNGVEIGPATLPSES